MMRYNEYKICLYLLLFPSVTHKVLSVFSKLSLKQKSISGAIRSGSEWWSELRNVVDDSIRTSLPDTSLTALTAFVILSHYLVSGFVIFCLIIRYLVLSYFVPHAIRNCFFNLWLYRTRSSFEAERHRSKSEVKIPFFWYIVGSKQ